MDTLSKVYALVVVLIVLLLAYFGFLFPMTMSANSDAVVIVGFISLAIVPVFLVFIVVRIVKLLKQRQNEI